MSEDDAAHPRGALITGATGALGGALVRKFHAAGYFVGIHYRSDEAGAEALLAEVERGGGQGDLIQADLRDLEESVDKARAFLRKHSGVEVLVNNAGRHRDQLFPFVEPDTWRHLIDANLVSMYSMTHPFIRARIPRRSGAVINVSSVSSFRALEGQVAYASAKSGIYGFTRGLAREAGRYGIRVNAIVPGAVQSPAIEELTDEQRAVIVDSACLRRVGSPEEVADVALFLASPQASFVSGQCLAVDGGIV